MHRPGRMVVAATAVCAAAFLSACQSAKSGGGQPITLSRWAEEYFNQYKRSDGPREFAIAVDGSYAAYNYCPAGQSACVYLSPSPQQRCEGTSGKTCKVFAIDGEIVWDGPVTYESQTGGGAPRASLAAQANKSAVDMIAKQIKDGGNGAFDSAVVPNVRADRRQALANYAKPGEHKALAVSARGAFSWYGARASVEDAALTALEECEFVGKQPCVLYAVNARVLSSDARAATPIPVLRVARGAFDPAAVPFVPQTAIDAVKAYAAEKSPKSLAVTLRGRWAMSTGKSSADEAVKDALEQCKRKGADTASFCVTFAIDDEMDFNPGN